MLNFQQEALPESSELPHRFTNPRVVIIQKIYTFNTSVSTSNSALFVCLEHTLKVVRFSSNTSYTCVCARVTGPLPARWRRNITAFHKREGELGWEPVGTGSACFTMDFYSKH